VVSNTVQRPLVRSVVSRGVVDGSDVVLLDNASPLRITDHAHRSAAYELGKRFLDVSAATLLLTLLLPVWIAVAFAVRLKSPGPIFFRQTRVGRHGRLFTCLKFRTMVVNAEALLHRDESLRCAFNENWKLHHDPRVTAVGRFLRKTSLDEVPQLINILRGEMSLVGPRPVQPAELSECYGKHAADVVIVTPGLTGLWQVSGRSKLTYEQRVALDLEYVARRSFWFDLKIALMTIPAILFRRGAV
jgi:exopolysaccharide production protein ExoY